MGGARQPHMNPIVAPAPGSGSGHLPGAHTQALSASRRSALALPAPRPPHGRHVSAARAAFVCWHVSAGKALACLWKVLIHSQDYGGTGEHPLTLIFYKKERKYENQHLYP